MVFLDRGVLPHQRRGRLSHRKKIRGGIINGDHSLRRDFPIDGVRAWCFPTFMELRKDPITRSWVITGDDVPETQPRAEPHCRLCPESPTSLQQVSSTPGFDGAPWSSRAVVHPSALYRIEGEPARRADGLYDRMCSIGAHEVLVENAKHDSNL